MKENVQSLIQGIVDRYFHSISTGSLFLSELDLYCKNNGYIYILSEDSVKFYEKIDSNNFRFAFEVFKTLSEWEIEWYAKKLLTVKWKCILDTVPIAEHIGYEIEINPYVSSVIAQGKVGYFLDMNGRLCIQLDSSNEDSVKDLLKCSAEDDSEEVVQNLLKHPNIMYVQLFHCRINGESCVHRSEIMVKRKEL